MKNTAFKIPILAIGISFSLPAFAQQTVTAKAPEVSGPVLQTNTENKTPVSPIAETKLHETAVKQSSFSGPAPVKANDKAEPPKAPQQKPPAETDKLVLPSHIKSR